jgi:hypothetical protein
MSKFVIALLFSLGAGTWIYTKLQRYSGNNTKQSLIGSLVAGVFLFIVLFVVQGMIY